MKAIHWINGALLAALFATSAYVWPSLPDQIPAHFGPGGVTRWSEPSLIGWFGMPLLSAGIVALNYLLASFLPRKPSLMNFPEKKQFLELPPERQAPVMERMQDFLYGISAMLIVLFGYIQWMTYRTAMGDDPGSYLLGVLLMTVLMTPAILIAWMPRIQRELRRQIGEHRTSDETVS